MKILILGGNRFFGKKLAKRLLDEKHDVTLLNRGAIDDGFGDRVKRIKCDRTERVALEEAMRGTKWDLVYDQVCFDYPTARAACEVFEGKTPRYIYTSTQSVYGPGSNLKEEDFRPEKHTYEREEVGIANYGEAKRQAEVGFFKHAQFPVTYVRLPVVIGRDDYTKRFEFHVNRIKEGKPIHFPNIEAQISFVTSDFAAEALAAFGAKALEGPINVASPEPIRLADFVKTIEQAVGKKLILASEPSDESHSPYGIKEDWFMNCDRLKSFGLVAPQIRDWLPSLLKA